MLEAIRYTNGKLELLDQLQIPFKTVYISIKGVQDAWDAIRNMQVRGAPAIAITGCLSLCVELHVTEFSGKDELHNYVKKQLTHLVSARPTAVNMNQAADTFVALSKSLLDNNAVDLHEMKTQLIAKMEDMMVQDVETNKKIGYHGAKDILKKAGDKNVSVLTHCNTGSLATAGYGTALGVIRSISSLKRLEEAYFTETRPFNQGSRLTAYELIHEDIPGTLICDSMVGYLMLKREIAAVVVGADRVVANGDTANKIGTYQIAVLAKYHGVPFYVAAPLSTIDMKLKNGSQIVVEERPPTEITSLQGIPIAAPGVRCWNPAFDITPSELITGGIITEKGVFPAHEVNKAFAH